MNVAETLREAMTQNRDRKVFVANGYYDLATPFFATEYTFRHMGLDTELRSHFTMDFFEAGHMEKVKSDLAHFIAAALPK